MWLVAALCAFFCSLGFWYFCCSVTFSLSLSLKTRKRTRRAERASEDRLSRGLSSRTRGQQLSLVLVLLVLVLLVLLLLVLLLL